MMALALLHAGGRGDRGIIAPLLRMETGKPFPALQSALPCQDF